MSASLIGPTPPTINRLEAEADGEPPVLYDVDEHGVCIITLNMSRAMNGWGPQLSMAWLDAYDRAQADDTVKVIVVTGRGRAWCAGAAMDGLQDLGASGGLDDGGAPRSTQAKSVGPVADESPPALPKQPNGDPETNQVLYDRRDRPINHALWITKPIIAAINGACAGGGMAQAMNCDIRFAAEQATFSTAFARRGLIAEWGISWALPRVVGTGNAMDLLLSARKFKGIEAKELGIVQRVFPAEALLEETVAYARDMADNVPAASLAVIKDQVLRHPAMAALDALEQTNKVMSKSTQLPNFVEGVSSFVEKRPPSFEAYSEENELVRIMRAQRAVNRNRL